MYRYLNGVVSEIISNAIVLDVHGVGYLIYTPNPYSFVEKESYKVYVYHYVREDEICLYGFKFQEELELFLKLITVKGLGPKMTLPILATGSVDGIIDAIDRENVLYLKKFPKIGDKVARQMILDLKGKLVKSMDSSPVQEESELRDALLSLGYKEKEIRPVVNQVDKSCEIDLQIKEALRLLLK